MIYQNLKYFYLAIIAVLICIIVFNKCNSVVKDSFTTEQNDSLKTVNVILTEKKDSVKVAANKSDSIRVKFIVKWRTKLHDTTIYKPCEELIVICDSIILVDSTEISQLKQVINYSDSIILNQKVMLYNDSLDLLAAKKYGKKQRRQKNLALLGLGVLGGVLLVK